VLYREFLIALDWEQLSAHDTAMAIFEDHAKTFAGGYISLLEGGRKALERSGTDAADNTFHRRQLQLIG
jgi:hypothetical protein